MKLKLPQSLIAIVILIGSISEIHSQVGVNILTPHTSAALQIESPAGTAKGLLTPSMTTAQRAAIKTGTLIPGDGLIVYDINHGMHYCYNVATNSWNSLSPLTLTTSANSSTAYPYGVITTPSSSATFSFGINKQNPKEALDVAGNATVSGQVHVGGNSIVNGSINIAGNASVNGSVSVSGFPVNALVPAGVITMFSGTLIPKGWAVCDGGTYNGLTTPDLRGKFIVGMDNTQGSQNSSGQYIAIGTSGQTPATAPNDGTTLNYGTIGNKGGENGHTLSLAEMPNHTHNVSVALGQNSVFGFNNGANKWIGSGTANSGEVQTVTATISENAKGNDLIHENRPPYYVLVYIVKLP